MHAPIAKKLTGAVAPVTPTLTRPYVCRSFWCMTYGTRHTSMFYQIHSSRYLIRLLLQLECRGKTGQFYHFLLGWFSLTLFTVFYDFDYMLLVSQESSRLIYEFLKF